MSRPPPPLAPIRRRFCRRAAPALIAAAGLVAGCTDGAGPDDPPAEDSPNFVGRVTSVLTEQGVSDTHVSAGLCTFSGCDVKSTRTDAQGRYEFHVHHSWCPHLRLVVSKVGYYMLDRVVYDVCGADTLNVQLIPLVERLWISPDSAVVGVGESIELLATALFRDGSESSEVPFVWSVGPAYDDGSDTCGFVHAQAGVASYSAPAAPPPDGACSSDSQYDVELRAWLVESASVFLRIATSP